MCGCCWFLIIIDLLKVVEDEKISTQCCCHNRKSSTFLHCFHMTVYYISLHSGDASKVTSNRGMHQL